MTPARLTLLWLGVSALAVAGLLYLYRARAAAGPAQTYVHEFSVMRTGARLVLVASPADRVEDAFATAMRAEQAVRDVERRMGIHGDGDVARLNAAPPGQWVAVHPDTWTVVMAALRLHRLTGGAFDPTVGPLKRAFDFNNAEHPFPDAAVLDEARARVGAGHLRYDREGMRLSWERPGMALDLGAVAKGFAADQAMALIQSAGYRTAQVEIGGEFRLVGRLPADDSARQHLGAAETAPASGSGDKDKDAPPGTRPWRAGVRHPRRPGMVAQVLERTDCAIATSGDYEQYFDHEGRRYAHILDPRSGMPVAGPVVAATVVHPDSCLTADGLATALCVLGVDGARRFFVERADDLLRGVEAYLYTEDGDGGVREIRLVGGALPAEEPQGEAR